MLSLVDLVEITASRLIDQFRYIKIQFKTIDLSTRPWGINTEFVGFYSPEPRYEVYCLRLNFHRNRSITTLQIN